MWLMLSVEELTLPEYLQFKEKLADENSQEVARRLR